MLSACSSPYSGYPYPYSKKPKQTSTAKPIEQAKTPVTNASTPSASTQDDVNKTAARSSSNDRKIIVNKGDTVYGISRKYGVSVRSLISLNNLNAPYLLKEAQSLNLPVGSVYTVVKGDTVYGVSRKNDVLMNELVLANNLQEPYVLSVGQKLNIPIRIETNNVTQMVVAPSPQISGKGFMWPLRGKVISAYGPKQAGLHNDGVNISAPLGSSVLASENGVVVHVDNKLKGYGNLLLIKHHDGWVTAYAHNDKILVKKGQTVHRGQVVANVGRSGRVSQPQLHFEMRKGSRAVNPSLYLQS
jgi:murein DD-endopeptidase MepM/ murein hydrolase activator NlpD